VHHPIRTLMASASLAALTLLATAPAHAGVGGTVGNDSYGAKVEVHLSGDVSRSLVGSVPGPPPMCWWKPYSSSMPGYEKVDFDDPVAVKKFIEKVVIPGFTGTFAIGRLSIPDSDYLEDVVKKVKSGADLTFYSLETRDEALSDKPGTKGYESQVASIAKACNTSSTMGPYGSMLTSVQAFPTGQQPPPAVDPEDLAAYAYEVMDLKKPALEWNPHLASNDDATLVNLPTWLWTRDPAAVEEREVTAEAAGVSVTVTAQPDGMTISSPVGGTQCSAEQARTAYAEGVPESSACVFTFDRGSFAYAGGFPVESVTGWQATWTSNAGPGGDLDPKTVEATTDIPVIEVQSRVNSTS
jgi:hypothetical protein